MEEKALYVTYQVSNGGFEHEVVKITGKINEYTVKKAIKENLSYSRQHECVTVFSWSETDEFTYEELTEFWKKS